METFFSPRCSVFVTKPTGVGQNITFYCFSPLAFLFNFTNQQSISLKEPSLPSFPTFIPIIYSQSHNAISAVECTIRV